MTLLSSIIQRMLSDSHGVVTLQIYPQTVPSRHETYRNLTIKFSFISAQLSENNYTISTTVTVDKKHVIVLGKVLPKCLHQLSVDSLITNQIPYIESRDSPVTYDIVLTNSGFRRMLFCYCCI